MRRVGMQKALWKRNCPWPAVVEPSPNDYRDADVVRAKKLLRANRCP
jgi:hypothetical protein